MNCHCGKPLHYSDPAIKAKIDELIALYGETVDVVLEGTTYLVPRHYIALHGLKGATIPKLGFKIRLSKPAT